MYYTVGQWLGLASRRCVRLFCQSSYVVFDLILYLDTIFLTTMHTIQWTWCRLYWMKNHSANSLTGSVKSAASQYCTKQRWMDAALVYSIVCATIKVRYSHMMWIYITNVSFAKRSAKMSGDTFTSNWSLLFRTYHYSCINAVRSRVWRVHFRVMGRCRLQSSTALVLILDVQQSRQIYTRSISRCVTTQLTQELFFITAPSNIYFIKALMARNRSFSEIVIDRPADLFAENCWYRFDILIVASFEIIPKLTKNLCGILSKNTQSNDLYTAKQNNSNTICRHPALGPTFGGGYDLSINLDDSKCQIYVILPPFTASMGIYAFN